MTNRTPNQTAAHSGSKPNSGAIPTTTGAKTGTVINAIAIHSINVPRITRIPIITNTIPIAGRPRPENSDLMKSAPPIRLYIPTKATAPKINQIIVPTVDIVPARAT